MSGDLFLRYHAHLTGRVCIQVLKKLSNIDETTLNSVRHDLRLLIENSSMCLDRMKTGR